MGKSIDFSPAGLWTDPNPVADAPRGAMLVAKNVVMRRKGLVEPRKGFPVSTTASATKAGNGEDTQKLFEGGGELYAYLKYEAGGTFHLNRVTGAGAPVEVSASLPAANIGRQLPATLPSGSDVIFTGLNNIQVISGDTVRRAGIARPGTAAAEENTSGTGFLSPDSSLAYRIVLVRKRNGRTERSAPSERFLYRYDPGGGGLPDVNVNVRLQASILNVFEDGDTIEVYRTRTATPFTSDPGDEMFLVTSREFANVAAFTGSGSLMADNVPDSGLGAALYTNASQEGILAANNVPPYAVDVERYGGAVWYANSREAHCWAGLLTEYHPHDESITAPVHPAAPAAEDGFHQRKTTVGDGLAGNNKLYNLTPAEVAGIRVGMVMVTATGGASGASSTHLYVTGFEDNGGAGYNVLLTGEPSGAPFSNVEYVFSDCVKIDGTPYYPFRVTGGTLDSYDLETATALLMQSFETGGFDVTAASLSPGQLFVCRSTYEDDDMSIEVTAPAITHGMAALTDTTELASHPARMYFSKYHQPEAVPGTNFLDVGDRTKGIVRAISTRDALWVFKEDGLYRVGGEVNQFGAGGSWRVDLIDPELRLLAPDSPAVVGSAVFAWTNYGVVRLSGISTIRRISDDRIGNRLREQQSYLLGSATRPLSFGVPNNKDNEYILGFPEDGGSRTSTLFVYNEKTDTWVEWEIQTPHMVARENGILTYSEQAYTGGVYDEQQTFTVADYHERGYSITVLTSATDADGTSHRVTLSAGSGWSPAVGDCIRQNTLNVTTGSFHVTQVISATEVLVNLPGLPTGARTVATAIPCQVEWTHRFASDPASESLWQDGVFWFKKAEGLHAVQANTHSDVSASVFNDPRWLTPEVPDAGKEARDEDVRFFVPRAHARAHCLFVGATIESAFASWELGGLRLSYEGASRRVRREYGASHSGTGDGYSGGFDVP